MSKSFNIMSTFALALYVVFVGVTGQDRIMGGIRVSLREVPFIASIFRVDNNLGTHTCGGSVISARHVLTAAHCFIPVLGSVSYLVRLGSQHDNAGGLVVSAETVDLHPDFKNKAFSDADIAIVTVNQSIPLHDHLGIKTAKLPTNKVMNHQILTAYGWGTTKRYGRSHTLQEVDIPVVSRKVCKRRYSKMLHSVTKNMFCAGFLNIGNAGTCDADSGCPIVENGILHGIVAYAEKCIDPYYPSVFTAVVKFVPWIRAKISML